MINIHLYFPLWHFINFFHICWDLTYSNNSDLKQISWVEIGSSITDSWSLSAKKYWLAVLLRIAECTILIHSIILKASNLSAYFAFLIFFTRTVNKHQILDIVWQEIPYVQHQYQRFQIYPACFFFQTNYSNWLHLLQVKRPFF